MQTYFGEEAEFTYTCIEKCISKELLQMVKLNTCWKLLIL